MGLIPDESRKKIIENLRSIVEAANSISEDSAARGGFSYGVEEGEVCSTEKDGNLIYLNMWYSPDGSETKYKIKIETTRD